jgi:fructose 5-dehydrogenase small subunit
VNSSDRDDAPPDFSLFRRQVLIGGGLLFGGLAAGTRIPVACADSATADFADRFMQLSSLLIPHQLDRDVGLRLSAALRTKDPEFAAHTTALLDIAAKKNAKIVEEFFSDVPEGPLKDAALLIISAWYLGVIIDAPGTEVFAYELALIYQPTIDVMTVPSYAISGPNEWTSEAPPLNSMPTF